METTDRMPCELYFTCRARGSPFARWVSIANHPSIHTIRLRGDYNICSGLLCIYRATRCTSGKILRWLKGMNLIVSVPPRRRRFSIKWFCCFLPMSFLFVCGTCDCIYVLCLPLGRRRRRLVMLWKKKNRNNNNMSWLFLSIHLYYLPLLYVGAAGELISMQQLHSIA